MDSDKATEEQPKQTESPEPGDPDEIVFSLNVAPDQKEATIKMAAARPLSSEDLIYVLETWAAEMKKRLTEGTDAVRTDAP